MANSAHKQLECFQSLNASQQGAIELTDRQRITIVQGPPGTGQCLQKHVGHARETDIVETRINLRISF